MYVQLLVVLIISISLRLTAAGQLNSDHDVRCQPVLSVVPVEEEGLPHFVKLNRCHGTINGFKPHVKKCTVENFTDVSVAVNVHLHGQPKILTLKNHTSCTGQCSSACASSLMSQDKNTCDCTCEHSQNPEGAGKCLGQKKWNSETCTCYCPLKENGEIPGLTVDKEKCEYV